MTLLIRTLVGQFDRLPDRLGALLLVGALGVSGCMTPYEKGTRLYGAEDYGAAETEVAEALEESPEDPQLNLLMARILIRQQEYREAEPHAKKAFEAEATHARGGRMLGKVYWELGQSFDAVETWRAARQARADIVSDEDFARALVAAIGTADSGRKFERSLELRKELAEIAPDRDEASPQAIRATREKLARDLVQRGEYEEAAAEYKTLAQGAEDSGKYAFERGRLLLRLDRTDEATEAFDRYVSSGEDDGRMNRLLLVARRAESIGKKKVSLDYYQRALETMQGAASFRRAKLHLQLAQMFFDTGDSDAGSRQLEGYLSDMGKLRGLPLEAEVYLTAADTAQDGNRKSVAIELLEKALEEAPPSWSVTARLARYYAVQARPDEVNRVLQLYIDRSEEPQKALRNAAEWAARRKNHDLARVYLERLLEKDDDQPDLWLRLARTYAKLGQINRFRDTLETFRRRFAEQRQQRLEVASMYREQQMFEEAEDVLLEVQKDSPKRLMIADRLAELYRDWGKPERVQKAYTPWIEARGGRATDYQLVGERLMRKRKMRQALPYLKKAAEKGMTDAWLEIADVYRHQRRELDMKEALDKYIEQSDRRARALRNALRRYRSTSLTRETTRLLEELIELEPSVSGHYRQLGSVYLQQGREEAAFALWKTWVERSRDTIDALRTVGRWFGRAGSSSMRLSFYRQWLGKETDPRLYRLIGDAYLETGFRRFRPGRLRGPRRSDAREKARKYYERYLAEANPTRSRLENFAASMRKQKMWSTAARAYSRMVESGPPGSELRFHYAQALMHLGQIERAIEFFDAYYDARGETEGDARKISGELLDFRKYDHAERYLREMFDSANGSMVEAAFVKLAETYQQTDRLDEIGELVKTYLSRAPNPAKARQTAVRMLEKRGLYEEAAEQIERIREFQGNVMGFDLGQNLFRAGLDDEAKAAFAEHAENNPYPGAVWMKVASFWENHARPGLAAKAYDRSVDAAPDDFQPRARRARFRSLQGDIEKGLADFEQAVELAGSEKREDLRKKQVETLREVGQFEKARAIAAEAAKSANKHKPYFLKIRVEGELATAEPARARRMIDQLAKSSLPVEESVGLLVDHGYRKEAAEIIERELNSGNMQDAGQALIRWPGVFTRLGSLDRLKRVARPLLERQGRRQATMRAQLGEFLVRQGDYPDGVVYLRSAHEDGRPLFRSVLAQTYALLDRHEQASRLFQRALADATTNTREDILRRIGLRLELVGQHGRFQSLLRYLSRDERYAAIATRFLIDSLLDEGRLDEAMERIRRVAAESGGAHPEAVVPNVEDDDEKAIVVALETLAANGYTREVESLIASLPEEVRDWPQIRDLELNMAAHTGSEDLKERARRAAAGGGSAQESFERRLRTARILSINGQHDLAAEVAARGMESSDPSQVDDTAELLLENAYAAGRPEAMKEVADTWKSTVDDKLGAQTRLGRRLYELGQDERALEQLLPSMRRQPTPDRLLRTLRAAAGADDYEVVDEVIGRYLRISDQPVSELSSTAPTLTNRVTPQVARTIVSPFWQTYPASLQTVKTRAKVAFRAGEPEETRQILLDYLNRAGWSPLAVREVFEFLNENAMWVEATRVFAKEVPDDKHTVQSRRLLGIAWTQVDKLDKAREAFDAAIDAAPSAAEAAVRISDSLFDRDQTDLGLHYANKAVELDPKRPDAKLFRGLHRLRDGQVEQAREDLKVGLNSGVNRMYSLFQAGRAALQADRPTIADEYLYRLARTPSTPELGELFPLRLAVEAYVSAGRASDGVQFLKHRFPRLASGGGIAAQELRSLTSSLYESAGQLERSFAVYRTGIQREAIRNPGGSILPVYLNNLAYSFSTSDRNIDEGYELVRRALAYGDGRTPSYIDTLGWLHYRKGQYDAAAREITRALGSTTSGREGLEELYEHLIAVEKARGNYEKAFWLEQFADSLK